jgi:hypothetical protein
VVTIKQNDDNNNAIISYKRANLTAQWPVIKPAQHKPNKSYITNKPKARFITFRTFN